MPCYIINLSYHILFSITVRMCIAKYAIMFVFCSTVIVVFYSVPALVRCLRGYGPGALGPGPGDKPLIGINNLELSRVK